jgi:hypothetical protein
MATNIYLPKSSFSKLSVEFVGRRIANLDLFNSMKNHMSHAVNKTAYMARMQPGATHHLET